MLENGFDLFATHTWKPLEEIVDAGAILEIREQCLNRHARALEHPRAADLLRGSLDSRAVVPIKHGSRLRDRAN